MRGGIAQYRSDQVQAVISATEGEAGFAAVFGGQGAHYCGAHVGWVTQNQVVSPVLECLE